MKGHCLGLVLIALLPSLAIGQIERPAAARRVVRTWTFDEFGASIEPVPEGWYRAQDSKSADRDRPGYPSYNHASLDREVSANGQHSMKLPTRGGSTSLILAAGVLPAIPDGDYVVTALVRTSGLKYARARLSTWLLNDNREVIEPSQSHSELIQTGGGWETLTVPMRGSSTAAWIQIELELLQPEQLDHHALPQGAALPEDFDGAVFFDDLAVFQVPRLELSTSSWVNVLEGPNSPELIAFVRDLTGERLLIELEAYDMEGQLLDRHQVDLPMVARRTPWTPTLPGYGWYRAVMRVSGEQGLVGQRHVDFIWTPPLKAMNLHHRRQFGLIAETLPIALHSRLSDLMRQTLIGAVSIAVWRDDMTGEADSLIAPEVVSAAGRMLDVGLDVTFVLANVPEALARRARVDRDDPLPVLAGDDESWLSYLGEVLTKFGERVGRWQFGATGNNKPFFHDRLAGDLQIAMNRFGRIVPRPRLALPWGAEQSISDDLGPVEALTIFWPVGISPNQINLLSSDWPETIESRVVIETLDPDIYGLRPSAHDLARRCVEAWAAGIHRLAIDSPWTTVHRPTGVDFMPSANLAVYINMIQQLAGREIVGELPISDGVRAYVARGDEDGAIIVWNESASPSRAVLQGYLGDADLRMIDPFGNITPLVADRDGHHRITISQTPMIIDGVDVELALFRARIRVDPSFIPARVELHERRVVIENPWDITISGRLRISDPIDWSINPRVIPFTLDPHEILRAPIEVSFNLGEEVGLQHMMAELELVATRRYPLQRLPLEIEIGLESIDMSASYRAEPARRGGAGDVVITVRVVNRTAAPITMEAFAHAPGFRYDTRPISRLEPGGSTVRQFRFPGGAELLKGKSVRVGIKELDGTGRLNKTLHID